VVVYTGKDLAQEEEARLRGLSRMVIPKDARSMERLLAETEAFLSTVGDGGPAPPRPRPRPGADRGPAPEPLLEGRKVLVVDDDVRNVFALTSILERWKMEVLRAESGPAALDVLREHPDAAVVLMDIMMPGMDGYEAIRAIRSRDEFQGLPIIALTAKAMKGDRQKCLDAGASDYVAKPVDGDQLLSMLRVWVGRGQAAPRAQGA
jgi:CheY-like chemotaxis protein